MLKSLPLHRLSTIVQGPQPIRDKSWQEIIEVHMPSQTGNSFQPLTTSLETYTPRRTPTGDPLPTPAPEAMHMFDLLAITNIIDAILFIQSLGSAVFPNSHTHRKE